MYFEEIKNELKLIVAEKAEKEKELGGRIAESEKNLAELRQASKDALAKKDDKAFVKLGGQIAVAEAQIEELKNSVAFVANDEKLQEIVSKANKTYYSANTLQAKKMLHLLEEFCSGIEELAKINDEYTDLFYEYRKVDNADNKFHVGYMNGDLNSDIRLLERRAARFINLDSSSNSDSLAGILSLFIFENSDSIAE